MSYLEQYGNFCVSAAAKCLEVKLREGCEMAENCPLESVDFIHLEDPCKLSDIDAECVIRCHKLCFYRSTSGIVESHLIDSVSHEASAFNFNVHIDFVD